MITFVPDVHGNTFWKEAQVNLGKGPIVFLGDFLDPYYEDSIIYDVTPESAIENFRQILEFKRSHPDDVVLLLGNHDLEYLYGKGVCYCRCDEKRYEEIQRIFRDNSDLFQIAAEYMVAGKRYIFTHAGIHPQWLSRHIRTWTTNTMVSLLNKRHKRALAAKSPDGSAFGRALSERDPERGGYFECGSPVWADAEILNEKKEKLEDVIQVVGHTRIQDGGPVITDSVIFTDCRKVLVLGDNGVLRSVDGKMCKNQYADPFHPDREPDKSFDLDCFGRPYCRRCGSHKVYVYAGMFVNRYHCEMCHIRDFL